ncbi:MAG: hypothetical protein ACLU0O_08710 [Collinsella sp.]
MTAFIICFLGFNLGYCATIDPFNVLVARALSASGNPQLWLAPYAGHLHRRGHFTAALRAPRQLDPKSSSPAGTISEAHRVLCHRRLYRRKFTLHELVLIDFMIGMGVIVWGLVTGMVYGRDLWFLAMGLLAGILGGLDKDR